MSCQSARKIVVHQFCGSLFSVLCESTCIWRDLQKPGGDIQHFASRGRQHVWGCVPSGSLCGWPVSDGQHPPAMQPCVASASSAPGMCFCLCPSACDQWVACTICTTWLCCHILFQVCSSQSVWVSGYCLLRENFSKALGKSSTAESPTDPQDGTIRIAVWQKLVLNNSEHKESIHRFRHKLLFWSL